MMKQVKFRMPLRMLALLCVIFLSATAFAQNITVKGNVKDATGEPIIGATVRAAGQDGGVITDFDGNFTLSVKQGTQLTISYIGYQDQKVSAAPNVNVTMQDAGAQSLNEVVVIGYGAVKKSDLTGSVIALKPDSKNKGLVVNAQDMLSGKVAGVNVTSDGGKPGAGATIRIRGGASLNASNDPLIVIDGIPMDNNGVKGLSNPLSIINPQDIESFNVLKDASATAIYGSRGSNGVIIITTKKGRKGQKLSVSYNGSVSISTKRKTLDVMNGDEYRAYMTQLFKGATNEADVLASLGDANTDWQDEIYRTAFSQDHGVTVAGSVGEVLPFRASFDYTSQQGILKTSDFNRYTASVNLSPSFFKDHLKINFNAKGMYADTKYANQDAIGAAVSMDPTHPVYSSDERFKNLGGYWEWTVGGGALNDDTWPYTWNSPSSPKNPVALLNLKNDRAHSKDFNSNIDIDYQVNGFEDLRFHLTGGVDIAQGKQLTDQDPAIPNSSYTYYGNYGWDKILKRNFTISGYAQYYHDFKDKAANHFDIMLGAEEQKFWRKQHNQYWSLYPSTNNNKELAGKEVNHTYYDFATESYLVSYFGRVNWSMMDGRYMVTATVRADGSSRYNWLDPYDDQQWGVFPSFAFAWRIKDENKFRDIKWLSDLKLRLGYGITGQQNLGDDIGDYPYYDTYALNTGAGSEYAVDGDGTLARPAAVNHALTWEKTATYNIGLDWGLFHQRVSGSVDWYYRKTTDLINTVYVPAGMTFKNTLPSNIGNMYNTGVEASIHWNAIQTKDWNWMLDYNFTYNKNRITKLTGGNDENYYVATGGISGGTGNTVQAHAVGHEASSFYVYQQVYDKNGKAIEGLVVDRNGDGQITDADRYFYKSPNAPVTMGLSSRLEWKNWDFGFTLRASIGNYVFNNVAEGNSNVSRSAMYSSGGFMTNRLVSSIAEGWQTSTNYTMLSDRWVQNGSFLKCDNITLGYSFNNLFRRGSWNGISGRVYAAASNVFTITNYDGIDPEVFGGIDNNVYPRPFSATLGLSLNF